ncbi:MAG: hypothetical protein WAN82_05260 [Candidatus Bathyarchaeia archaeon]
MRHKSIIQVLLILLIANFFIGTVGARGGVFVIEPTKEVIDTVELTVSNNTSANVCGNLSVIDGFIDFYVTSPSGIVLLCYNRTALNRFNFTAVENGTYLLHLRNTLSANNITATLDYGVNWQIALHGEVSLTWHTSAVWKMAIENPTPFDWIAILKWIWGLIAAVPTINELRKILLDFLRRLYWKKKHGKSTTPVVIKRFLAIMFSYFKL